MTINQMFLYFYAFSHAVAATAVLTSAMVGFIRVRSDAEISNAWMQLIVTALLWIVAGLAISSSGKIQSDNVEIPEVRETTAE